MKRIGQRCPQSSLSSSSSSLVLVLEKAKEKIEDEDEDEDGARALPRMLATGFGGRSSATP